MKRALYITGAIALLAVLPVAVIMLAIPLIIRKQVAKISAKWQPETAVLFWSAFWSFVFRIASADTLAILYNEGASKLHLTTEAEAEALAFYGIEAAQCYPMGDLQISRGPAVGSGQVLRSNVQDIWDLLSWYNRWFLTAPTIGHLALPGYERQALYVCLVCLSENIASAGDFQGGAQRYNGGTSGSDASIAYAAKAEASVQRATT